MPTSAGEPVALEHVPPVLFSELMRDVDLFVSVASIGNDPAWGTRDAGAYGEYWTTAAFGELTETAKTRHAVLKDLLPGLTIADRCRLEERFLVVTGKLRTYRIHLGSSNILMEPNDQYLCIVQDHRNPGAPRPPAVRGRQHALADPLEGVPAGRRRQDQGPRDHVADQGRLNDLCAAAPVGISPEKAASAALTNKFVNASMAACSMLT